MPVSFLPIFLPMIGLGFLIWGAFGGWARLGKTGLGILMVVSAVLAPFYIPGAFLRIHAGRGDAQAQYRYARWVENTPGAVGSVMLWPLRPNVMEGYRWLERAAKQDFAPALYVQGVRLKYGTHIPKPENWPGSAGNVFPQPGPGQERIDRALDLGFRSVVQEELHYWHVYRGLFHRDPHG